MNAVSASTGRGKMSRSRICIETCVLAVSLLVAGQSAIASDMRLVEAASRGDFTALKTHLDAKADVNSARADGTTALAWAVYHNDSEIVNLLINSGADVNASSDYGVTPLHLACENQNPDVLRKLLKAGADPNRSKLTGETPLMACANTGSVSGVEELLAHGADVNAKENNEGQTALMWAAAEKNSKIVRMLVAKGADVHARSEILMEPEPFIIKIDEYNSTFAANYPDGVRFPRTSGGGTALLFAAQQGDLESVEALIEAGADVNTEHQEYGSVLIVSIASGHEDLAIFLLEKGANPNVKDAWGITPLHYALHEGLHLIHNYRPTSSDRFGWKRKNMPNVVKVLLDHGANPDAQIEYSYPFLNDLFLARSTENPPQVDPVGATPLLLAAVSGDAESMRILVEKGNADKKASTIGGATVLMLAAGVGVQRGSRNEQEALQAASLALNMGGDVNQYLTERALGGPAKNKEDGRTAIHAAAYLGWNDMISFLVKNGADVNAKDRYGMTPLMIALGDPEGRYHRQVGAGNYDFRFRSPAGDKKTAELLLELGAEPFTGEFRDRSGE